MNAGDIKDCLRLINGGSEAISNEPELAHSLLTKMKDAILSTGQQFEEPEEVKEESQPKPKAAPKEEDPLYDVLFQEKPLGMSWNQTSDGLNLYVQDITPNGLAEELGVGVGSVIYSFNSKVVYDQGPEKIYLRFKACELPIRIGFMRPAASSASDPKVLILKQVTGLETQTVIKLLHKFNGNVQAANEAFYIAKARTRQWMAKQDQMQGQNMGQGTSMPTKNVAKSNSKTPWWGNWVRKIK